jgi:hypothetical protein
MSGLTYLALPALVTEKLPGVAPAAMVFFAGSRGGATGPPGPRARQATNPGGGGTGSPLHVQLICASAQPRNKESGVKACKAFRRAVAIGILLQSRIQDDGSNGGLWILSDARVLVRAL